MDVTPTATGQAAKKTAAREEKAAPEKTGPEAAGLEATATDFQTFLTLLTTQMRNQDPLNPTDSTEFVAQLASFSGVEQQVRANDQLGRIHEALGGGASAGLAAWIGTEVRAAAQAAFSGGPVEVLAEPAAEADRAVLAVKNDFGETVARVEVSPTAPRLAWDGRNALGEGQPHGLYAFEIESYKGGELIATRPGEVFAKVTEVRIEAGAPVLVLAGGARAGIGDVTALR